MPAPVLALLRAAPPLPPAQRGQAGSSCSPAPSYGAWRCPARSYLFRFFEVGGEVGAGALRQRAEAGGRAGETLLAQLPHGVLRRCLVGSKAGDARPRPGTGGSSRARRPVPQQLGGPLTFSRLCRAANSPSRNAAILELSAEASADLPLTGCRHLGAVSGGRCGRAGWAL